MEDIITMEDYDSESIVDCASTKDDSSKDQVKEAAETECTDLYVRGIPRKWTVSIIKHFIRNQTPEVNLAAMSYDITILKDINDKPNGHSIWKFNTHEEAKIVYDALQKQTLIKNLLVRFDIGGVMSTLEEFKMKNREEFRTSIDKFGFIKRKNEPSSAKMEAKFRKKENRSPDTDKPKVKRFNYIRPSERKRSKIQPPVILNERSPNETYGLRPTFLASLGIVLPLNSRIYITNLATVVGEEKLQDIFRMAGQVIKVVKFPGGKEHQNRATVEFDHPLEAVQAISMFKGKILYGREMFISMDTRAVLAPKGLSGVGEGLGPGGEPLKGIRTALEMQKIKNILVKMGNYKIEPADERSPFANPLHLDINNVEPSNTSPANLTANVSSDLSQANLLLLLSTLLSAQGLFQQGTGNDLTSLLTTLLQKPMTLNTGESAASSAPDVSQNEPNVTSVNLNAAPQYNQPSPDGTSWSNIPPVRPDPSPLPPNAPSFQQNAPSFQQNAPFYQIASNLNKNPPNYNQSTAYPQQTTPTTSNQSSQNLTRNTSNFGQNEPNLTQEVPSFTPVVPSFTLSLPSFNQTVPSFNQTVPSFNQTVPSFNQTVPSFNQTMPSFTQSAPNFTQSAPSSTRSIPSSALSVPCSTSDVPNFIQNAKLGFSEWKTQTQPKEQSSNSSDSSRLSSGPPRSHDSTRSRSSRFDQKYKTDLPRDTRRKDKDKERKTDMLIITNLPSSVTTKALTSKMMEVGELLFGEIAEKGRAIVRFKHKSDAERCIKLFHRSKVDGQVITVKYL